MKTKLALIAISVVLLVSLTANGYFLTFQNGTEQNQRILKTQVTDLQAQLTNHTAQTNRLQNEKANLETQTADLQTQQASLSNQTENLRAENAYLQNANAELENQLSQIPVLQTAPKILTRLGASDVRSSPYEGHPWSGVIRFYISGEVWNVGTADAHGLRLHVTLHQWDAVANDSYVDLGTVEAGSYVQVTANIYYTGEPLTSWTIVPEYS